MAIAAPEIRFNRVMQNGVRLEITSSPVGATSISAQARASGTKPWGTAVPFPSVSVGEKLYFASLAAGNRYEFAITATDGVDISFPEFLQTLTKVPKNPSSRVLSPKRGILENMKLFWEEVSGNIYFAKRGPIDFTTYDFNKKPRACAIMVDNYVLRGNESSGKSDMDMSFEIFTSIDDRIDPAQLQDTTLEDLEDDVNEVFDRLVEAKYPGGDNLVFSLSKVNSVEAHDIHFRLQGIVVTFSVEF